MTSLLAISTLGFLLGMRHATDPDHVVAVTTIVTRHRSIRRAALVGVAWGFGHTCTILAVGGAVVLLGWVIPTRLGLAMEFAVAIMLVVLGAGAIFGPRDGGRGPRAEAGSGGTPPGAVGWLDERLGHLATYGLVRPMVVGIVHGMAGSAAVAILVMTAIGSPAWSIVYLGIFGAGTIAGMMAITAALAVPFAVATDRAPRWTGTLRIGAGLASVLFGLFLAYQIGVVDGLFGPTPTWDPH